MTKEDLKTLSDEELFSYLDQLIEKKKQVKKAKDKVSKELSEKKKSIYLKELIQMENEIVMEEDEIYIELFARNAFCTKEIEEILYPQNPLSRKN